MLVSKGQNQFFQALKFLKFDETLWKSNKGEFSVGKYYFWDKSDVVRKPRHKKRQTQTHTHIIK